jgi:carbon storage regulator CsrA
MLVLTRKAGEQIVIPQLGVVVTVVEARGQCVRLGIAAPPDVAVKRPDGGHLLQQTQERTEGEALEDRGAPS